MAQRKKQPSGPCATKSIITTVSDSLNGPRHDARCITNPFHALPLPAVSSFILSKRDEAREIPEPRLSFLLLHCSQRGSSLRLPLRAGPATKPVAAPAATSNRRSC